VKRRVLVAATALIVALVSAGCGSDEAADATAPSPSPTPTPTPTSVVWAGQVCEDRDNLSAAVSALGSNLSYDVTSDRSALEQIDRQLRVQVLSVADAANRVGTTLAGAPVDFVAANDLVVSVTKAKDDASEAIDATTASLDAMMSAGDILTGVAEAGKALVGAKAAFEAAQALVTTVTDATSTASGELQEAFDAAPQCQEAPAS